MELCELSAYRLSELIKKKEVSPKEILDSVLKRIKEKEAEINAYITVTEEIAKLQAEEAEKRQKKGELLSDIDGIPIAIKDNICT
ncbi:MAG: Asp-tRNA(Asn)/Glu-tRNA(Gln) amidotransferase GatCAB subunit A, partial [Deltaproteobacteria bacterium]